MKTRTVVKEALIRVKAWINAQKSHQHRRKETHEERRRCEQGNIPD
jgi:hypothetical protein